MAAAFLGGLGFGALVAAQVGPIWLLCARSALRSGFVAGLAIGVGAATIDMTYAALGAVGAASALRALPGLQVSLGVAGAAFLIALGVRTVWSAARVRQGLETEEEVRHLGRAVRTALIATASNPLTILSWAALFTAASAAAPARTPLDAAGLVVGVGLGSLGWFSLLSAVGSLTRRRIGPRTARAVDVASGIGLVGFGGLLGWEALHRT